MARGGGGRGGVGWNCGAGWWDGRVGGDEGGAGVGEPGGVVSGGGNTAESLGVRGSKISGRVRPAGGRNVIRSLEGGGGMAVAGFGGGGGGAGRASGNTDSSWVTSIDTSNSSDCGNQVTQPL